MKSKWVDVKTHSLHEISGFDLLTTEDVEEFERHLGMSEAASAVGMALSLRNVKGPLASSTKVAATEAKAALPQHTKHSLNQKMNRNVRTVDELDAIRSPLDKKPVKFDSQGRPSQRYVGSKAEVAINPETNKIVSVNPTSAKKTARLERQRELERWLK
ncbi:hypothetical protein J4E05_16715 [Thalassospira sp. NFXS8]|uniref:hypothetical protein n=1 Tax=Thalassospira sp. NFXS8 TaxID=2819093 RepID=UPI0032DE3FD8